MPKVSDLLRILQHLAPSSFAEDWDNVGLLVGNPEQPVQRVLIALDPCLAVIEQARSGGYDLVITHHPVIFRALKSLHTNTPLGAFIAEAMCQQISVIACHTNLDSTVGGVNDYLATALGLCDTRPLVPSAASVQGQAACGAGRIGVYPAAITPKMLLEKIRKICSPPWILEAGPRPKEIRCLALCGGSGSDLAERAFNQGADVYLTAELKHAVARWAEDAGIWLLDAGHFPTENPAMQLFRDRLYSECTTQGLELIIDMAIQDTPLRLV